MATSAEFYQRDIKHRKSLFRTSTGNLELEDNLDNILNQLYRRLITAPGSIVHRPNYGVGLPSYKNSTLTFDKKEKISLDIKNQLEEDDRVDEVTSVSFNADDDKPDTFKVSVKVNLVGYGEQTIKYQGFEG